MGSMPRPEEKILGGILADAGNPLLDNPPVANAAAIGRPNKLSNGLLVCSVWSDLDSSIQKSRENRRFEVENIRIVI